MSQSWTRALREWLGKALPAKHVLPDEQPTYVRSAVYCKWQLVIMDPCR